MTENRFKTIDITQEFSFPLLKEPSSHFQKIVSYQFVFPHHFYELEDVSGSSLIEYLVKYKSDQDQLAEIVNKCLNWYHKHCLIRYGSLVLMRSGDSHLGNIIYEPSSEAFTMIDYYSDFNVVVQNPIRPYIGFISSLKKIGAWHDSLVSKLRFPDEITLSGFEAIESADLSDLADSNILYNRDHFILDSLQKKPSINSRCYSILNEVEPELQLDYLADWLKQLEDKNIRYSR